MIAALLFAAAAAVTVRTIEIPEGQPRAVRIMCPVGETTRVVLPERALGMRKRGESLPVRLVAARPLAAIDADPPSVDASALVEFRGPTGVLKLEFRATAKGVASEIHLVYRAAPPAPPPPAPSSSASPVPSPAPSNQSLHPARSVSAVVEPAPSGPGPSPSPAPPTEAKDVALLPSSSTNVRQEALTPLPSPAPIVNASGTAPAAFDLEALLLAQPQRIERREGLPGQPPVVLEDALRSDRWVWLRFRLQGGAHATIQKISWEHGEVGSFRAQPAGSDLRLVVQVPRALVTKHTRIDIRVLPGGDYTFPVSAPWLSTFIRDLF